jgi:hypothetical protein
MTSSTQEDYMGWKYSDHGRDRNFVQIFRRKIRREKISWKITLG